MTKVEERVHKLESTIKHLLSKESGVNIEKLVEAAHDKQSKSTPKNCLTPPRIQSEFYSEPSKIGKRSAIKGSRRYKHAHAVEFSTAVMSSSSVLDAETVSARKVDTFHQYSDIAEYESDKKEILTNPLESFGQSTSLFLCEVFNIDKKLKSGVSVDAPNLLDCNLAISSILGMDESIDAYFRNIHNDFPVVSENQFRSQYMASKSNPSSASWKVFFNIVSALGAWSCEGPGTTEASFYRASKVLLNCDIIETANCETVTSLALFSYYSYKKFQYNISWVYLGMATRIAISLGMPYTSSSTDKAINEVTLADSHDRIWQNLISIDIFLAILYSKPCSIPFHLKNDHIKSGSSLVLVEDEKESSFCAEFPACDMLMRIGLFQTLLCNSSDKALYETLNAYQACQLCQEVDAFASQRSSDLTLKTNFKSLLRKKYDFVWKMANIQVILTQQFLFARIIRNFKLELTDTTEVVASLEPVTMEELECQLICLNKSSQILRTAEEFMGTRKSDISAIEAWDVLNAIHMASLIPLIYYTCYEFILQDWSSSTIGKVPPSQKSIKKLVDISMDLLEKLAFWHAQPSTKLLRVFQIMMEETVIPHAENEDSIMAEHAINVGTILSENSSDLDITKSSSEVPEIFGSVVDCFGFLKPTPEPIDVMPIDEQAHQW